MTRDFDIVAPHASSLVESLRAFSYGLPTAIADLVDNSISASAKNIWVDFHWDGEHSVISVTDDGIGMSSPVLVSAMRLGSQSPIESRRPQDLGRFGLGLKTASFSQCRRVTVQSQISGGRQSTCCWDLDHIAEVNEWQLLREADAAVHPYLRRLVELPHGTAVIWQKMDRIISSQRAVNERAQQNFLKHAEAVRCHLAMVFHQLIAKRSSVTIWLNNRVVEAWDPFLEQDVATQVLPVTQIRLSNAEILIEPFVLPHHSKISRATYDAAAGVNGWNAHQGFYVYRNRRLLVAGDWLGLGWAKEDQYKLARIRVQIPNSVDLDWGIDVTKSRALPPVGLREDLRRIAERTRCDARRVYSHRGAMLLPKMDGERVMLWETVARHNQVSYRLNRQHPLLKRVFSTVSNTAALSSLVRLIEETIPLQQSTFNTSENPQHFSSLFENTPDSQIKDVMEQAFESLVASGYRPSDAVGRLRTIWPFELFPTLLQTLLEDKSND